MNVLVLAIVLMSLGRSAILGLAPKLWISNWNSKRRRALAVVAIESSDV